MKTLYKWLIVILFVFVFGVTLLLAYQAFTPTVAADLPAAFLLQTSLADLTVQLGIGPPQPQVGESATITVTITNQGSASARDFCSYLYVDPPDEPPNQSTPETYHNCLYVSLPAGYSYSWSKGYVFTSCGEHHLYAWVDRDDDVPEEDEENNLAFLSFTIPCDGDCTEDTYEEDDTCDAARSVLPDGVHYRHTLCPVGDEDWIRVDMTEGLEYIITTEDVGQDGDTTLELYDYCDEPPLAGDDPALGPGAQIVWPCTASGTYYVRVAHHDASYGPDTHYDLSVQVRCAGDGFEPDNTCETSRSIIANANPQDHLFCSPDDVDWVRFQASAGLDYHIAPENIGPDAEPRLALYQICGDAPLVEGSVGQALDWTCTDGGLYYVRILDDVPSTYGPTAYYQLRLTATGHSGDAYEPDDNSSLAKPILTDGAPQSHTTAPSSDQDWLYFDAVAGQSYRIETSNLGPASDTMLVLYDADATTWLARDDDNGSGLASRIWWTCPATGRYYLMVRDYRQDVGGGRANYDLAVTAGAQACDDDGWEDDDTYYQAQTIATDGTWQHHNTCPQGDVDWVRFWVPASSTFALETASLGHDADTVLTLYGVDGQTVLWTNDDVGPGRQSRILWNFWQEGVYYLEVQSYGNTGSGHGTEYSLRVVPSTVTPTPTAMPTATPMPTPLPTPSPTPSPTPPPSAHTLIVTNRERLETLYGQAAADDVMASLTDLAGSDQVLGVLVDVGQDDTAAAAYASWSMDPTDVTKANLAADAVRNAIVRQMDRSPDLQYILLVGDDRVIPFRRVADRPELTGAYESLYPSVSPDSTVGSALQADTSLNDDFYADRTPDVYDGQPVYLPDVAIARLVETPSDITGTINSYLASPNLVVNRAMVAGYSVFTDGSQQICNRWAQNGVPGLDCTLVNEAWGASQLKAKQLQASPRFDLQALATGANHYIEGSPQGTRVYAQDIVDAPIDLSGALIWNTGRYSGLNVPPTNPDSGLDLPEAFVRRGANYVGNSGTTLVGSRHPLMAERLMSLFAEELVREPDVPIGKAWMQAKRRYYLETMHFCEYDRKVLSVATMYGLPMAVIDTGGGSLGPSFPSVEIELVPEGGFGEVTSATLSLDLVGSFGAFEEEDAFGGNYFSLDEHAAFSPDEVAQPQYYASTVGWGFGPVQGLVWLGGQYLDVIDFDPLRPEAVVLDSLEPLGGSIRAENSEFRNGWSPPLPATIRGQDGELFNLFLGQYHEETGQERLYARMSFDLYFGHSCDQTPPTVDWIAGRGGSRVPQVKVEASDASGIHRVVVAYTHGDGWWDSLDLDYNPDMHKWIGTLPARGPVVWFAQVVDGVGNVTTANNKGTLYHLTSPYGVHLPLVLK